MLSRLSIESASEQRSIDWFPRDKHLRSEEGTADLA